MIVAEQSSRGFVTRSEKSAAVWSWATEAWADTSAISDEETSENSDEDTIVVEGATESTPWYLSIVPDHGFHPVVIHFPIALFLFGVLLEVFGTLRKDTVVRRAAFWNLAAGAISTVVVIPTGVIAYFLSDYTFNGGVVIHIATAACAIVLMAATALWRRKGQHTSPAYFTLLATAAIALGVAGYFGGELIYGL